MWKYCIDAAIESPLRHSFCDISGNECFFAMPYACNAHIKTLHRSTHFQKFHKRNDAKETRLWHRCNITTTDVEVFGCLVFGVRRVSSSAAVCWSNLDAGSLGFLTLLLPTATRRGGPVCTYAPVLENKAAGKSERCTSTGSSRPLKKGEKKIHATAHLSCVTVSNHSSQYELICMTCAME